MTTKRTPSERRHGTDRANLRAALAYAAKGWHVAPPLVQNKKHPSRRGWQHESTTDPATIRRWFEGRPTAGLAVKVGPASGLLCIDVDRHTYLANGEASLTDLQRFLGALPSTRTHRTPSGGRHLFFRWPDGVSEKTLVLAPGVDGKLSGIVVMPPTRFDWVAGLNMDRPQYFSVDSRDPADLPETWVAYIVTHQAAPRNGGSAPTPSLTSNRRRMLRRLATGGATEGERNSSVTSIAGHLLGHGIDPVVAGALIRAWNRDVCVPPLEDQEVLRAVASIARRERDRRAPAW